MKEKIYISGWIILVIILTGTIFKLAHLAGAGILLTAGIASLVLLFLPVALANNYKTEGNRQNLILYIMTWITCFIVFTAMLFKIQHWPFAGLLLTIALPFPYVVFLPVFLSVTSKNKNFNIYHTVFVLALLAVNSVLSGLLSLNVTRDRIYDSYNISSHYNNLEKVLNRIPVGYSGSPVVIKVDEALKLLDDYRNIILTQVSIAGKQWNNDPEALKKPESRGLAATALIVSGEPSPGSRLFNCLNDLVVQMENTPGCEELAKAAPAIMDLRVPPALNLDWGNWKFNSNNLAWVLTYLDGLETNLNLIKVSLIPVKKN